MTIILFKKKKKSNGLESEIKGSTPETFLIILQMEQDSDVEDNCLKKIQMK